MVISLLGRLTSYPMQGPTGHIRNPNQVVFATRNRMRTRLQNLGVANHGISTLGSDSRNDTTGKPQHRLYVALCVLLCAVRLILCVLEEAFGAAEPPATEKLTV